MYEMLWSLLTEHSILILNASGGQITQKNIYFSLYVLLITMCLFFNSSFSLLTSLFMRPCGPVDGGNNLDHI